MTTLSENNPIRVAIVGGGIAGITAARAISNRLQKTGNEKRNVEIVVFEADSAATAPFQSSAPPLWTAATARNANSIVPGAAMHIMSQRSTLKQIAKDTVSEFLALKYEAFRKVIDKNHDVNNLLNIDNFEVPPPYFAFHVLKCLGPRVSWEERR